MIKVAITVQGSGTAVVARLQDQLAHPRPLHEAAAAAVCNTVQRHFLGRNSEPNKHGWPSKNFWSKEGFQKTAVAEVSDAGATVGIASPAIAHKRTGGTVTPKRGKYLAIPITAAAYLAGNLDDALVLGDGIYQRVVRRAAVGAGEEEVGMRRDAERRFAQPEVFKIHCCS